MPAWLKVLLALFWIGVSGYFWINQEWHKLYASLGIGTLLALGYKAVIGFYSLRERRAKALLAESDLKERKRNEEKPRIRSEIRRLKLEYRKEHQMPGSFSLGADYYVERIKADADLIREVVETEGEKER